MRFTLLQHVWLAYGIMCAAAFASLFELSLPGNNAQRIQIAVFAIAVACGIVLWYASVREKE